MKSVIVLDSTPLGLIVHRRGTRRADECREWVHVAAGRRLMVPEIVDFELRRELIRLGKANSLVALDIFNAAFPDRFMPVDSASLRLAAGLWATARQQGVPTADRHALDIDVILAAQVLSRGLSSADVVVATSNVVHLAPFVPAQEWWTI